VVGVFKPYHSCWHFAVYAVVVFAALLALGLVACKGRLGGLKEARGGRCATIIALFFVFKKISFILTVILLLVLFAFPAHNSLKTKPLGKIFAPTKNFAQTDL
jgi:hypothetical protein